MSHAMVHSAKFSQVLLPVIRSPPPVKHELRKVTDKSYSDEMHLRQRKKLTRRGRIAWKDESPSGHLSPLISLSHCFVVTTSFQFREEKAHQEYKS